MTNMEEAFRVCGLCSQLVDESVEVSTGLRIFLISFLGIDNAELPTKVCLECYTHTVECKRFKDRCDKTISKLQRSDLYSSMILGRSSKDLEAIKKMPLPAPTKKSPSKNLAEEVEEEIPPEPPSTRGSARPGPKSKAGPAASKKKPGPGGPKRNNELKGLLEAQAVVEPVGPRSRRSEVAPPKLEAPGPRSRRSLPELPPAEAPTKRKGSTQTRAPIVEEKEVVTPGRRGRKPKEDRAHGFQPVVNIRKVERQRADREFQINGCQRSKFPLPKAGSKRGATAHGVTADDSPPQTKRGRRVGGVDNQDEVFTPPSTSSFGRKRTVKTDNEYVYMKAGSEEPQDDDEDATPLRKRKSGPATKTGPASKPAKTATPSARGRKPAATREEIAFVEAASHDDSSDDDDDDDDGEEMFPSIGPYQCEICQNITDTKQEFVDHIKDNHRDIVDEEVLTSLEKDLKKSRKKAEKEKKKSGGKKATPTSAKKSAPTPPAKKTPASAKKAAATPARGQKTPAKAAAASPVKKATPASRKRAEAETVSAVCKICNAVLGKTSPSEIARHQNSRACRSVAAAARGATNGTSDNGDLDPLDDVNGIDHTDDDVLSRTCQYCQKIVDDLKDLPRHYSTKSCIAKKYQMENGKTLPVDIGGDIANHADPLSSVEFVDEPLANSDGTWDYNGICDSTAHQNGHSQSTSNHVPSSFDNLLEAPVVVQSLATEEY